MATDYVRGRERLSQPSAEEETHLSVANELLEESGNRRVKVNLTKAVLCLEPLLDLAVANFLLNVNGLEIGRDVLVDLDSKCLSDSKTSRTRQNENHPFPLLLPPC